MLDGSLGTFIHTILHRNNSNEIRRFPQLLPRMEHSRFLTVHCIPNLAILHIWQKWQWNSRFHHRTTTPSDHSCFHEAAILHQDFRSLRFLGSDDNLLRSRSRSIHHVLHDLSHCLLSMLCCFGNGDRPRRCCHPRPRLLCQDVFAVL